MPLRRARSLWLLLSRRLRRLARSSGSAHSIALGAAIGIFVGFSPTMGLQMVIAAFIATLVRANRLSAILPVWITNPVTFIPIYLFSYQTGYFLTGIGPSLDEVRGVIKQLHQIHQTEGSYAASQQLLELGLEGLLTLVVGCCILGVIFGVVTYFIAYKLVLTIRGRLHAKRARRAERILKLQQDAFVAGSVDASSFTVNPIEEADAVDEENWVAPGMDDASDSIPRVSDDETPPAENAKQ